LALQLPLQMLEAAQSSSHLTGGRVLKFKVPAFAMAPAMIVDMTADAAVVMVINTVVGTDIATADMVATAMDVPRDAL